MAFSLLDLFAEIPPLNIVDIGAGFAGDAPPYAALLKRGGARVVGFEPDAEQCAALNAKADAHQRYLPYFIGDGGEATFYRTNRWSTSSLLPPNRDILDRYQNLGELVQVQGLQAVRTRRLDDIADLGEVDFIKIDVQGAELAVFKAASRVLANCLAVHTEVEFLELYKDQPLFADVDTHLRGAGFQFHTFIGFGSRCAKPFVVGNNVNVGLRQYIWADALYIRDIAALAKLTDARLMKLALLLHDLYQSYDFCYAALEARDTRDGGGRRAAYMDRLRRK